MTENATCEHGKPIDHWCEECRRTDYEAARGAILAHPCECVPCSFCGGSGTTWLDFRGRPLGNYRCDDLDSPEPCDECDGGIVSQCWRCGELDDLERAYFPEEV